MSTETTINLTMTYVSQNLWLDPHETQIFEFEWKCSSWVGTQGQGEK